MKNRIITYTFRLPDNRVETFRLEIDGQNLELAIEKPEILPEWTELEYNRCEHCTLDTAVEKYCPLSANLAVVVQRFNHILSFDELELEVVTDERFISQKTTAQRALSSFMGLVMATSGCPYTVYFKPMARFHLPLASEEETIYRSVSMYLLAQYFQLREGGTVDFDLQGLEKIYADLLKVNTYIVKRLKAASKADSSVNAVLILDMYARAMPYVIEESLEELRYLFSPYLDND